ncbi:hypothetical protein [Rhodococcus sp. (in: high G+C Gram-positive bacteria)]|uniref:hypothetical protein n=1 Tax=Rhodococcus sp. TaxID=1831 RepID=UPI001A2A784B|nr:hypothetical protein [Rhodococcus sp. (in: high G+C Gram-positive bacteria)]MBJ7479711.1 hypothetical protein [Rhodococcus sp. (in: high G+C Gram-positive bacteria)]
MVPMLRQNVIVHEISLSTSTPWHIYGAAVLAGLIAIVGWIAVHYFSKKRDQKNWQRTMITETVSEFIELSQERFHLVEPYLHTKPMDPLWDKDVENQLKSILQKLKLTHQKILLCAYGTTVASKSQDVLNAHMSSDWGIRMLKKLTFHHTDPERQKYRNMATLYDFHVMNGHNELLRATQRELGQRQIPSMNLQGATVVYGDPTTTKSTETASGA